MFPTILRTVLRALLGRFSRDIRMSHQFFPKGKNWRESHSSRPLAVLWAFSRWKGEFIADFLPEYRVLFAKKGGGWKRKRKILDSCRDVIFVVWGHKAPPEVIDYAAMRHIPLHYMEDGFIRSADLGCKHTPPFSLVLDSRGLYFDATRPSDLEYLLNTYDFTQPPGLLDASRQLMSVMRALRVSKYNIGALGNVKRMLGPKRGYRILVVGQLESDASLRYGLAPNWTNLELLQKAHSDYPEAEIVYRPHPDTLHLQREDSMDGQQADFYRICAEPVVLADLFAEVDHVYTMTSLSGMEALIHGLPVTVVGMPFYAGWGLTHDVQRCSRRVRTLTLDELFCGVYILYPRYLLNLDSPLAGCAQTMVAVVKHRLEHLWSKNMFTACSSLIIGK
jgi:capsular polysaccharide export protein